jgi:hypothetical protein
VTVNVGEKEFMGALIFADRVNQQIVTRSARLATRQITASG